MNSISSSPSKTCLNDGDRSVNDNREKADLLAKNFETVSSSANYSPEFLARKIDIETNQTHLFANDAPVTEASEQLNVEFTWDELRVVLSVARKHTSPGADKIAHEFLRRLPELGKMVLLKLFNRIWSTGRIPQSWRHAVVVPILKVGKDPRAAVSYRPISLTSTLCKLMERLVANRLQWFLEKNRLLSGKQSGFRRNRSTIDPITRLHDTIVRYTGNSHHVLAVFLDMEKAFDMMWRKGLLIKLKRYGINGHMFEWFNSFLTRRTFQVRVGAELSESRGLENGFAQGAMISPSQFIIMMDDLPDDVRGVVISLFADDSMAARTGRNLPILIRQVQQALDAIQAWCDQWGFRISTEKTVAVLFSPSMIPNRTVELQIRGQQIRVENSARFLGLIFDRRLTWAAHIEYVRRKCQKRLNLMRAVSGTRWGANHRTLKMIYKAMIRSVLDYGAVVLDSASTKRLMSIEDIQNQAMRLCCGSMRGTATAALQVECGLMPLALRRLSQQIKLAVKVDATDDHLLKSVFTEHWTEHRRLSSSPLEERRIPILLKVRSYMLSNEYVKARGPTWARLPPWRARLPAIDTDLTLYGPKDEDPHVIAAMARDKIEGQYRDCIKIFTDASRLETGVVGIGCLVMQSPLNPEREQCLRITDNVTVYAGELSAIGLAFQWIKTLSSYTGCTKFAIFTDSLSSVQSFVTGHSASRQDLMNAILDSINGTDNETTLVWVPSHVGILGNERADRLAAKGTELGATFYDVGIGLQDAYSAVDRYIEKLWQSQWENGQTGSAYRALEPKVTRPLQLVYKSRALETMAHRLRLGSVWLNACLFKIGCHDTGLCDVCQVNETIDHHLLVCPTELSRAVRELCDQLRIEKNLGAVLSNIAVLETIHRESVHRL
jgi:ribonuclease HI